MTEKCSRRKAIILATVIEVLESTEYSKLTIEEIAHRAGVGKSTIYRWWTHKAQLVFDAFKQSTACVFELDFTQSLKVNLVQQLSKLSQALQQGVGRALLAAIVECREAAGAFFQQYLLPRREQMRKLIDIAIEKKEIKARYCFELMLDTLYAPIHYQIIFFNRIPDTAYIEQLVDLVLDPIVIPA
ncbi:MULTISPECIES: TetR/AcrR family transcriptional regulator [unclassified Acinetobacter]|uniref:TetR/AcrR family transcriptional regulator n=1 Tax=unclassified Acinetobacter TaxID=196816 RepID=UPI002934CB4E|nr:MULTISPECIES: TetR/AcrR family transcriptional regulator [unclassified Acinetobacter]WOE32720.1 TetR/AcrR family transcriptional regulator [Acinetobacter sp. SAAs470]WOE38196.1 TetR/AcrR family transcriptional regulator [Acinetobacter sp. SAAs474]